MRDHGRAVSPHNVNFSSNESFLFSARADSLSLGGPGPHSFSQVSNEFFALANWSSSLNVPGSVGGGEDNFSGYRAMNPVPQVLTGALPSSRSVGWTERGPQKNTGEARGELHNTRRDFLDAGRLRGFSTSPVSGRRSGDRETAGRLRSPRRRLATRPRPEQTFARGQGRPEEPLFFRMNTPPPARTTSRSGSPLRWGEEPRPPEAGAEYPSN